MLDRGEKVVRLARELLRSEILCDAPNRAAHERKTFSYKNGVLAFLFGIALGAMAMSCLRYAARPMDGNERMQIEAFLLYASHQTGLPAQAVENDMLYALARRSVQDLTHADFTVARDYLLKRAQ